ncbi:MAG TPA: site-specific integrase [Phycisphaerae bacterium]|nr:site-specific integrase [Phycisphaerae bacterium]
MTRKTLRMDYRVSSSFSEWCQKLGIIQERAAEAIFLYAIRSYSAGDLEMLREPETVWLYRPASDKSEHLDPATEKVVLLGPRAQEAIRPLLTADPAAWVFRLPAGRGSRGGPTAGGPRRRRKTGGRSGRTVGDRYTPDTYRRAVQRGCEQAGVATWHPHQLRHAFATEIRRVASLDAARVLLGHRFAETTEIYAEADRTGALDALRRLG